MNLLKRIWAWLNPQRPETKWSHIETEAELIKRIHAAHAAQDWELHEELCEELFDRNLWDVAP